MLEANGTSYEFESDNFTDDDILNVIREIQERDMPRELENTSGPDTFMQEMDEVMEVPEADAYRQAAADNFRQVNANNGQADEVDFDEIGFQKLETAIELFETQGLALGKAAFLMMPLTLCSNPEKIHKIINFAEQAFQIYQEKNCFDMLHFHGPALDQKIDDALSHLRRKRVKLKIASDESDEATRSSNSKDNKRSDTLPVLTRLRERNLQAAAGPMEIDSDSNHSQVSSTKGPSELTSESVPSRLGEQMDIDEPTELQAVDAQIKELEDQQTKFRKLLVEISPRKNNEQIDEDAYPLEQGRTIFSRNDPIGAGEVDDAIVLLAHKENEEIFGGAFISQFTAEKSIKKDFLDRWSASHESPLNVQIIGARHYTGAESQEDAFNSTSIKNLLKLFRVLLQHGHFNLTFMAIGPDCPSAIVKNRQELKMSVPGKHLTITDPKAAAALERPANERLQVIYDLTESAEQKATLLPTETVMSLSVAGNNRYEIYGYCEQQRVPPDEIPRHVTLISRLQESHQQALTSLFKAVDKKIADWKRSHPHLEIDRASIGEAKKSFASRAIYVGNNADDANQPLFHLINNLEIVRQGNIAKLDFSPIEKFVLPGQTIAATGVFAADPEGVNSPATAVKITSLRAIASGENYDHLPDAGTFSAQLKAALKDKFPRGKIPDCPKFGTRGPQKNEVVIGNDDEGGHLLYLKDAEGVKLKYVPLQGMGNMQYPVDHKFTEIPKYLAELAMGESAHGLSGRPGSRRR